AARQDETIDQKFIAVSNRNKYAIWILLKQRDSARRTAPEPKGIASLGLEQSRWLHFDGGSCASEDQSKMRSCGCRDPRHSCRWSRVRGSNARPVGDIHWWHSGSHRHCTAAQ